MKILHIISSLKMGGAERALYNLITTLKPKEHEHHVAYFHPGPFVEAFAKLGIKTYPIKGLVYRYDPWAYASLRSLIKTINPNVIHSSLWAANIFGRLAGQSFGIPVISDLHGNAADEGKLRNLLERSTAHMSSTLVAISDAVAYGYKTVIKTDSNHMVVIKNGIDPDAVRAQATGASFRRDFLGIPEDAFVIGSVGRIEAIKAYNVLIEAFSLLKDHPKAFLVLVGDGSQLPALKAQAQTLGIQRAVLFAGHQENPYPFYPLFDCFALSSTSEGLSLALLEALSFGLPIVTTHTSMIHDVITHGIHGLLVPPHQPIRLAQAFKTLLNNPKIIQSMRAANAHLVDEHFHIQHAAERYNIIFTKTTP